MQIVTRRYDRATDFERAGRFLLETYGVRGRQVNWLQPRREFGWRT